MMMSPYQIAKELGCSLAHVRKMVQKGYWPYYRIGPRAMKLDLEEIRKITRLQAESERAGKK